VQKSSLEIALVFFSLKFITVFQVISNETLFPKISSLLLLDVEKPLSIIDVGGEKKHFSIF
jgi:hypothetical protein